MFTLKEENTLNTYYTPLMCYLKDVIGEIKVRTDFTEKKVWNEVFKDACLDYLERGSVNGKLSDCERILKEILVNDMYIFDIITLSSGAVLFQLVLKIPGVVDYMKLEVIA